MPLVCQEHGPRVDKFSLPPVTMISRQCRPCWLAEGEADEERTCEVTAAPLHHFFPLRADLALDMGACSGNA